MFPGACCSMFHFSVMSSNATLEICLDKKVALFRVQLQSMSPPCLLPRALMPGNGGQEPELDGLARMVGNGAGPLV